jgi:hypothetical protein
MVKATQRRESLECIISDLYVVPDSTTTLTAACEGKVGGVSFYQKIFLHLS